MTTHMDSYLANISDASLEVLKHFGAEAPIKLNTYACQVEDALLEALKKQQEMAQEIAIQQQYIATIQKAHQETAEENKKICYLLTDPAALINYVSGFFGPDGPYPGRAVLTRCPIHGE